MVRSEVEPAPALLLDWLAIPSVSADPRHAQDVVRAAEWLCEQLRGVPRASVEVRRLPGGVHPSVIGTVEASLDSERAPTVAVYSHFDVQPPGPREQWVSDPFIPEVRDGWLYARGAADTKGNAFALLEAIKQLASSETLPVNLALLFDSEEEINGPAIPEFVSTQPTPDAALICDGSLWDERTPSFATSLRGTLYYQVTVQTAERELHSGGFGGAALNSAHVLIDCLHGVRQLDLGSGAPVDEALAVLIDGAAELARAGARPVDASAAAEFYQRTVRMSAIDVNSICAGEIALRKTAIPERASADVSVRLGPGADHAEIDARFRARIDELTPAGAEVSVELLDMVAPGEIDAESAPVRLAVGAFERVFGIRPVLIGHGGTLALFSTFAAAGVPVIETGFADPHGSAHAVNERIPVRNLQVGTDAICELFRALGEL